MADLDTPPFRAYPVTGGITFSDGGLKLCRDGQFANEKGDLIPGFFGCGEILGGVFYNGYPDGSGLTTGAVFGRRAGVAVAKSIRT